MRMKKAIQSVLTAILLQVCSLSAVAFTPTQQWTPQPYRRYLIQLEVKRDTTVTQSVMFPHLKSKPKVDINHFKVGPFWVPDPPSLFQEEDEWRDRDRYSKGRWVGDVIEDIINIFLL